jgi:hypothetical protein
MLLVLVPVHNNNGADPYSSVTLYDAGFSIVGFSLVFTFKTRPRFIFLGLSLLLACLTKSIKKYQPFRILIKVYFTLVFHCNRQSKDLRRLHKMLMVQHSQFWPPSHYLSLEFHRHICRCLPSLKSVKCSGCR